MESGLNYAGSVAVSDANIDEDSLFNLTLSDGEEIAVLLVDSITFGGSIYHLLCEVQDGCLVTDEEGTILLTVVKGVGERFVTARNDPNYEEVLKIFYSALLTISGIDIEQEQRKVLKVESAVVEDSFEDLYSGESSEDQAVIRSYSNSGMSKGVLRDREEVRKSSVRIPADAQREPVYRNVSSSTLERQDRGAIGSAERSNNVYKDHQYIDTTSDSREDFVETPKPNVKKTVRPVRSRSTVDMWDRVTNSKDSENVTVKKDRDDFAVDISGIGDEDILNEVLNSLGK